jgi:hypothetical protein
LTALAPDDVHLVFYEELCQHPRMEIGALFEFLGRPFYEHVLAHLSRPAPLTRPDSAIMTGASPIESWRDGISSRQLDRALEILQVFGLDRIYSEGPMPNVQGAYNLLAEGT